MTSLSKYGMVAYKAYSTEVNMSGPENLFKTLWRKISGPRGEFTIIILLDRHSVKLPSKYFSLYPQISAVLRRHQRSFFLYWSMVNVEMESGQNAKIK